MSDTPQQPWTAERVRNELLSSDAKLKQASPYNNQEVLRPFAEMVKRSGLTQAPTLSNFTPEDRGEGRVGAVTMISKEGNYYIHLDPTLSPSEALASLAHELGHVVHGDLTPESIALKLQDLSHTLDRQEELAADDHAALLCQGRQVAAQYQSLYDSYSKIGKKYGVVESTIENTMGDAEHPPLAQRIQLLTEAASREEVAGRCPVDPNVLKQHLSVFGKMSGGTPTTLTSQQASGASSVASAPVKSTQQAVPPR